MNLFTGESADEFFGGSLPAAARHWRQVAPGDVPAGVDFSRTGPARFWLFTLKALAFIALRSQRPDDARELLARITALDPQAHIGDDVIATLLASVTKQSGG